MRVERIVIALALALPLSRPLAAQDARLAARLDKPPFPAVNAVIDSARLARLPTAPLVDKALEGAAKGSEGTKIVAAVQQLSMRMGTARKVLGTSASADEIKVAASAIAAGVSGRDLAVLRSAAGKRAMTMPLQVLTDLIGRDIPVPTATNLVLQLERSGVKDADLSLFQRNVRADIERGAEPAAAASTRARGLVARVGSAGSKPSE
jgi:hypothetical protein